MIQVVWLGPSAAPLLLGLSIPQANAGIWGGLFTFARMHILWLGVIRYFICIYMSFPLLPFFFFFLCLGLCSALMAHWRRGTRCGHVFDPDWLGSLVFSGNFFNFPHFSRQRPFDINLSFLLFLPLATFLLSFYVWSLKLPTLRISPFVFSVSS